MKKLLIFHPTIAPYRIDFFNDLYCAFDTRICLLYRNLKSQKFDYTNIEKKLIFSPVYLRELIKIGRKTFYGGFWKQLREFNPDIVIVSAYDFDALLAYLYKFIYRKNYKIVAISDDSYNMVAEGNDFSRLHKLSRKLLAPKMDELILIEPQSVKWHQEHFGKGLYFPIIRNAELAREVYKSLVPKSKETVIKYNLLGKRVFLFVGRLVKIKNVSTAIIAFSRIDQKDNVFVVVGDGPEIQSLKQIAKEHEANVIFTGRLEGDELYQWYNISSCFVLASYQEPFGAVTNEALLAGCWSLISKKAGSQCLIEDGKNGYTFNPMDVDELEGMMTKSLERTPLINEVDLKDDRMLIDYKECMNNLIKNL